MICGSAASAVAEGKPLAYRGEPSHNNGRPSHKRH